MNEPANGSFSAGYGATVTPDILRVLAQSLADEQLAAWFPGLAPQTVRDYLLEVAARAPEPRSRPATMAAAGQPSLPGHGRAAADRTAEMLFLFTDGASRGNPGEAGAGMVILDAGGLELFAGCRYLGSMTNNMAEYQALLHGLREAKRLGAGQLTINLDSELIVRQLQGRYRVKDAKLIPLYQQAQDLLSGFKTWRVGHVPRARNARADQLANQAIDERKKTG